MVRTRHLNEDGTPRFTNRLAREQSPYLLQHAHNPVDWHPWGEEALRLAKESGKPILLSVGYSTCHWCHVMEEESFEDEEVARTLNELYVPIKVDREERPDVDAIYMTAVQAMTGHGGWPMTVWLKSDGRPYYGGTYFPARDGDRGARTGFLTLVKELARLYQADPPRIEQAAHELTGAIKERLSALKPGGLPDVQTLTRAFKYYQRSHDRTFGGMNGAPKFPSSLPVRFLLRYHQRFGDLDALAMAELALTRMAQGGIYDHVGGGFHRYAVDDMWLVPHFEKMLYDNALLASAYVEAWQLTKKPLYANTARETLDYVLREMTADHGGFFSATDADSPNPEKNGEREEGWFFTWTPKELEDVLGPALAKTVAQIFGVEPEGNFEGRTVLSRQIETAELKAALNLGEPQLEDAVSQAKPRLFQARAYRPAPLLDDKILAAWNGLMISAMAKAGEAFGEPRYLDAAVKAARFVMMAMTEDGRLKRSHGKDKARHEAYLEDYACVVQGLADLYEATLQKEFLAEAVRLADVAEDLFADAERGGHFATSSRGEALIVREKTAHDGATPSGSSVLASALIRLGWITGRADLKARAEGIFKSFDQVLQRMPAALSEMLIAVDAYLGPTKQVQFQAPRHLDDLAALRQALGRRFVPRRAVTAQIDPTVAQPTAMICNDTVCNLPTSKIPEFESQL